MKGKYIIDNFGNRRNIEKEKQMVIDIVTYRGLNIHTATIKQLKECFKGCVNHLTCLKIAKIIRKESKGA